MVKKHYSGFVPVRFKSLGKILLPISSVMVIIGGLRYLAGWSEIPIAVIFIGLALLLVSLYLIFVVPKE